MTDENSSRLLASFPVGGTFLANALGPTVTGFVEWVFTTKVGLTAKACFDAGSALRSGASPKELIEGFFRIQDSAPTVEGERALQAP